MVLVCFEDFFGETLCLVSQKRSTALWNTTFWGESKLWCVRLWHRKVYSRFRSKLSSDFLHFITFVRGKCQHCPWFSRINNLAELLTQNLLCCSVKSLATTNWQNTLEKCANWQTSIIKQCQCYSCYFSLCHCVGRSTGWSTATIKFIQILRSTG